jgi:hypothetical protein
VLGHLGFGVWVLGSGHACVCPWWGGSLVVACVLLIVPLMRSLSLSLSLSLFALASGHAVTLSLALSHALFPCTGS